jgi:hypothetical protein
MDLTVFMSDEILKVAEVKQLAAQLLGEGQLTKRAIADQCGVTAQTIWNWRKDPEFLALIDKARQEYYRDAHTSGDSIREARIMALRQRIILLRQIMVERAKDPDMAEVPGGTTGLMIRDVKTVRSEKGAETVSLYAVDKALLSELREHEKQLAIETGQWSQKIEYEAHHEIVQRPDYSKLTVEEINVLREIRAKLLSN